MSGHLTFLLFQYDDLRRLLREAEAEIDEEEEEEDIDSRDVDKPHFIVFLIDDLGR